MALTRRALVGGLAVFAASRARAEGVGPLPAPTGKPILTISGLITVHNRGDRAVFDRAMLEQVGWASFRTRTPWYDHPVVFEGVPMKALMHRVGASGTNVVATALNDYTTDIPMSDFTAHNVLMALKRDGAYMPVSDKGPLFIVYPYDSDPDLQRQIYYSRSAWQVAELNVA